MLSVLSIAIPVGDNTELVKDCHPGGKLSEPCEMEFELIGSSFLHDEKKTMNQKRHRLYF
jgi:hypothetical protein